MNKPVVQTVTRNDLRSAGALRVAAYRERHGVFSFTVDLPRDVVQGIEDYMKFKNVTRSAVITKLVRSQLLRKR